MKILFIQLKRAGDVIVTTPVISALKAKYPASQIDFLVDKAFAPVLEHHPGLTAIEVYDRSNVAGTWARIRANQYDQIFDFQCSPRSAMVCIRSGAKMTAGYRVPFWGWFYDRSIRRPGSGLSVTEGKFSLVESVVGSLEARPARQVFLTPQEKSHAADLIQSSDAAPAIGLIPTHRHGSRRWHASSFASVGRRWREQNASVWLFWGPGEKEYVEALAKDIPGSRLIPSTSFREMAALLARCRVVITNDNGPMHLATAVGVPTVTVYGPTDPLNWNPGGPQHLRVQAAGLTCLACNLNRCPFGHECMTRVTPEQVYQTSQQLIQSPAVLGRA